MASPGYGVGGIVYSYGSHVLKEYKSAVVPAAVPAIEKKSIIAFEIF